MVERGRLQMAIWRIRIACWVTRATNTHSEYVILIAFPPQQWLHERPSTIRLHNLSCCVFIQILTQACFAPILTDVRHKKPAAFLHNRILLLVWKYPLLMYDINQTLQGLTFHLTISGTKFQDNPFTAYQFVVASADRTGK